MRRAVLVVSLLAVLTGLAVGAVWIAKRTIRWNDSRTMPPPLEAAVRAYSKGNDAAVLDAVRTLLRRYRAPAWEPRARVLAAASLARRGGDRDILTMLPNDLASTDPLATYAQLLRARGYLARGDASRAEELARRAATVGGSPFADDTRLVLASALESRGDWADALRTLDADPSPAATIAAARVAVAHGDMDGARRRLVSALLNSSGADAVDRLRVVVEELLPDATSRFNAAERPRLAEKARQSLGDGHAQMSLDLLALTRTAGAPSAATPEEALVEAEALLKLGRVAEAGRAAAWARRGDAAAQDGASYIEARIAAAQGRFGAYRNGLETLGRRGTSPWRQRALLDLARTIEGVPNVSTLEAYRRYRLAAGAAADPLALLREGWAAYELGRNAEAEAAFARALARTDAPNGVRATAMYWRARMGERTGATTQAHEALRSVARTFPNHYYGMLAAKRLGLPAALPGDDVPPLDGAANLGTAGRWLGSARSFVSIGLWDEAAPCYSAAVRDGGVNGTRIALEGARAARNAAALSDAIGFAQLAAGDRELTRPEDIPRGLWQLLYPAPPAEAILRAARESNLDPDLVAAVALQESAFNPIAVSSAGARGLLQVMPAVGAELAKTMRLTRFDVADLFDPETNLRLGAAHLRDYVRHFDSVPKALAAYNGGPSRVERWTAPPGSDDERFVERIPIPETRLYVKRVLAAARMYAIAWPGGLGAQ